ncbi:MAG: NAD(P)/FAD-dependent oxidoreductase [Bacteroidales bacterium]
MNSSVLDVIVIGAGHAGLSISYFLKKLRLNHLVFEEGKIGNTWRNQRWNSFKLNTPNKMNLLPGQENILSEPEGFCSASDLIFFLEGYSEKYQLPVIECCKVTSVEKIHDSTDFSVAVSENGYEKNYRSKQVVVASGGQNIKNIPTFSKNITPNILQLHAAEYRNASLLPDGAVLIVGSAQSGIQIAEDLIETGRKVFISTSRVSRVPRRYRSRDITDWLTLTGFFDLRATDVTDPGILNMKQPQISTAGPRGHTISLQALARNGAVILGRMEFTDATNIFLRPDAASNIRFADESSKKLKEIINEYIQNSQLNAPPPEEDPEDEPDKSAASASSVTKLNLAENHITSIIWTTGFTGDFSYLKLPVFNGSGILNHYEGISDIEGLYFLGLPWLRKRKSAIIFGIKEDAELLADSILAYSVTAT